MTTTLIIPTLEALAAAAGDVRGLIEEYRVAALYGEMGAGKTTFIRELCQQWGVADVVTSPTFAIINEYTTAQGTTIHHCDGYRLTSPDEFRDIGGADILAAGDICLIEWPGIIARLLPQRHLVMHLVSSDNGTRQLTVSSND